MMSSAKKINSFMLLTVFAKGLFLRCLTGFLMNFLVWNVLVVISWCSRKSCMTKLILQGRILSFLSQESPKYLYYNTLLTSSQNVVAFNFYCSFCFLIECYFSISIWLVVVIGFLSGSYLKSICYLVVLWYLLRLWKFLFHIIFDLA